MEVHHHPHVEQKGFKEYFLEFLMIFLAVTLGFFAENLREYFVNREKEQEFVKSFYEDLGADQIQLPRLINNIQNQQVRPADSLPTLFSQARTDKPANIIYLYLRRIFRQQGIRIYVTDRTIAQVKNAGEMRLISNRQLSDSLVDYYKEVEFIDYLQQMLLGYKNKLKDELPAILRAVDYNRVLDDNDDVIYSAQPLFLGSLDPATVNRIEIEIAEIKGLSLTVRNRLVHLKETAGTLQKLIAEKYHIDKE